jgi:hypothetical protein
MAVSEGKPTASDVKGKLQGVLKELETYKDLYRKTCQELEAERELRIKVRMTFNTSSVAELV